MDKRSLIFILSLTLTLFMVNTYFQTQRDGDLKEWSESQRAKKSSEIKKLKQEIQTRSRSADQLGIVPLYTSSEREQKAASGIKVDDAILALKGDAKPSEQIYSNDAEFTRTYSSDSPGGAVLYTKETGKPLEIGTLPYFGKYELYVVTFPGNENQTEIFLGDYEDGHFTFPKRKLRELQRELDEEPVPELEIQNNGIVLSKIGDRYLPVAIYQHQSDSLIHLNQIADLPTSVSGQIVKDAQKNGDVEEKFYKLENDYQQILFSNHGGAIVEINLPFESDANQKSVVKEIEFDRQMVEQHPYNALFPSKPFHTPSSKDKVSQGKLGGYYPLLRRDLIETGNRKSMRVPPKYYALNIVSEFPETAELPYEVKEFKKDSIVFETSQRQRRITKTYTLGEAPYTFDVAVKIEGDARGLWITSGVPEVEWISNAAAPSLKYRVTSKQKSEVLKLDLPKETITMSTTEPDWVSNSNGFLGVILDPISEIEPGLRALHVPGTALPTRLVEIDENYERFKAQDLPGYMMLLPLKAGNLKFRVFAGPYAENILEAVDSAYSNKETGYNPDYIAAQSYHGWFAFISAPFAKFLFFLMKIFYQITGSWAFSIILLTVALRLMLYPLNAWSTKSMLKMQKISPKVQQIQAKYGKKDPQKAQLEIMNLYRKEGVNPVSGCFPIIIQMPFLFGMFDLLKSSFQLRGATFIPGWIDNLAAPDVLFTWDYHIPFIGNEFHLLPILLGVVMFFQQRMMSTLPNDPNEWTDQQRQQRAMGSIMAVFFTFMFYNFPSGLNIYWLSSMLLGILQQWWTQKQLAKKS